MAPEKDKFAVIRKAAPGIHPPAAMLVNPAECYDPDNTKDRSAWVFVFRATYNKASRCPGLKVWMQKKIRGYGRSPKERKAVKQELKRVMATEHSISLIELYQASAPPTIQNINMVARFNAERNRKSA